MACSIEGAAALIRRLGVPADDMPLSGPYPCPLHPRTGRSMSAVRSEAVPGRFHFSCVHVGCGFSGSGLELAAAVRKCPVTRASELFKPGQPLHGTLFNAAASEDEYLMDLGAAAYDADQQASVKAYLASCREMLKKHTPVATACEEKGLKERDLVNLPAGLLAQPAPACLSRLNDKRHADPSRLLVLPYTVDGMVTAVAVYCPSTRERDVYPLPGMADRGVFMDGMPERSGRPVIVCRDELDAMTLYSKSREIGRECPAPVCLLNPPSLDRIRNRTSVLFVTHPGAEYTVPEMLELGRHAGRGAKVFDYDRNMAALPSGAIPNIERTARDLWNWCSTRLMSMSPDEAVTAVQCAAIEDSDKTKLLKAMSAAGARDELLAAVRKAACVKTIRKVGPVYISRTASGYFEGQKQLTNFTVHPKELFADRNNKISGLSCVVRTDIPTEEPYHMELPYSAMLKSARHAAHYIGAELMRQHSLCRPFIQEPSAPATWPMLPTLFDVVRYEEQNAAIGHSGGMIVFPHVRLDPEEGTAHTCRTARGLNELSVRQYAGVECCEDDPAPFIRRMLASDSLAAAGFMGLLAHAMHQIVAAHRYAESYRPRHLIVPRAMALTSMWDTVMRQAYSVFSGGESGMMSVGDYAAEIDRAAKVCRELNRLPAMALCSDKGSAAKALMDRCGSSLTLSVHSPSAVKLNSDCNCYYMREDVSLLETLDGPAELPEDIVSQARRLWIPAARALLANVREARHEMTAEELPALKACIWLAKTYGVELSGAYGRMFTRYFADEGVNTPQAFLLDIRQLLESGEYHIADSTYQNTSADALGYRRPEGVILYKAKTMKLIAGEKGEYDAAHLTEQMSQAGMLVAGQDGACNKSHWIINDGTWTRYVETRVEMMPEFTRPKLVMVG